MPKSKPASPSAKKAKSREKSPRPKKVRASPKPSATKQSYTKDYSDYLERYELYGEGRRRLSPAEFDRLDDEMLELYDLETDQRLLTDEQNVRLNELEFLLLVSD